VAIVLALKGDTTAPALKGLFMRRRARPGIQLPCIVDSLAAVFTLSKAHGG
jgi:hypothetical protein